MGPNRVDSIKDSNIFGDTIVTLRLQLRSPELQKALVISAPFTDTLRAEEEGGKITLVLAFFCMEEDKLEVLFYFLLIKKLLI